MKYRRETTSLSSSSTLVPILNRHSSASGASPPNMSLTCLISFSCVHRAGSTQSNVFPPHSAAESPLIQTLRDRKPDFFDLLLAWGADPLRIDADTILSSY